MLTYETNGCSMCHADILRKNPTGELFSEHHSQEAEQSDDWRGRTLYANHSVQNAHKQTHNKRDHQHFHGLSSVVILWNGCFIAFLVSKRKTVTGQTPEPPALKIQAAFHRHYENSFAKVKLEIWV